MFETQFALPEDFDGNVRLFPLPNLVLFPGNIQPLHVFESRYVEMFEDTINSDQLIAMATLLPGFEGQYFSRPKLSECVCVGRVVDHQKREDGTYDLILLGLHRAAIRKELPAVRSYRAALVSLIGDTPETPSAQGPVARQLFERFQKLSPESQKILDAFQSGEIEMSHFVDIMAFSYPFDLDVELQILKEPSAIKRAELMLANLPDSESTTSQTAE